MKYSCYYIIYFGCLMGFNILFYIIFGTNLLTGGPVPVSVFCLCRCFAEKEYQMESKRNETFAMIFLGTNAIQKTWSWSLELCEGATRQEGAPRGVGTPPPSWDPRSSTDVLLSPIYILIPWKHPGEPRNHFSTATTFCTVRSPLGTFSGDLPEGDSITEGFYINTIASPMMCE